MRTERVFAFVCLLLPALTVVLPLLHAGGASLAPLTVASALLSAAVVALTASRALESAPPPAPARAVLDQRSARLPRPLAVTVPAAPSRPRAPGRI